ncbi:poly(R)-hydroxyalkanoic acid synthase subunit PhaE [Desulfosarcina sp.]|uniref:poly(R)-hydroxyalkanoic acid synthase subunit PhaE n=1 Tax=Desulfosarcina sp. TaxID=2027861 RepID=UPI0035617D36
MNMKNEDPLGMATMLTTWMKSMGDMWGNMAGQWGAPFPGQQPTGAEAAPGASPKTQAAMAAALKNWQSMAGAMAAPESMTALFKGSGAMPEVLLKLAQTSMGSLIEMQQKMIQRLGRMGQSVEAYQFQDIDDNLSRLWTDIYTKEFQQFFKVPQLGLMRTYQEKANQAVDKYNLFQSTLSEFLNMLGLPFNRSMQVMQEKLGEMAENGELTDDTKVYYNMWVKVLEGHFMTLFQTPEYVETLTRTVNALAEYSAARNAALEDMLSVLPVAKKTEMDDMAKELFELKKRLRRLEKEKK